MRLSLFRLYICETKYLLAPEWIKKLRWHKKQLNHWLRNMNTGKRDNNSKGNHEESNVYNLFEANRRKIEDSGE